LPVLPTEQAETAWNTLGPTAAELTASHFKLIPKRDVEEHLEARSLEFEDVAEALAKRAEMPEQLERRHLSEKAKTFWKGVGNGVRFLLSTDFFLCQTNITLPALSTVRPKLSLNNWALSR